MPEWEYCEKWLRSRLSADRFAHSLGAMHAARELAMRFGEDPEKAALAGLLHDCGKSLMDADAVRAAVEYGFPVDDIFLECPFLLHAPAGAWIARETLGVSDRDTLSAICWHTVPRLGMTGLDKLVSVADLIEPERDYPGVLELRDAARRDLDETFLLGLEGVMIHVLKGGRILHPMTVAVYNEMRRQRAAGHGYATGPGINE